MAQCLGGGHHDGIALAAILFFLLFVLSLVGLHWGMILGKPVSTVGFQIAKRLGCSAGLSVSRNEATGEQNRKDGLQSPSFPLPNNLVRSFLLRGQEHRVNDVDHPI